MIDLTTKLVIAGVTIFLILTAVRLAKESE